MRNSFSQFRENGQQKRKKNLASPSVTILRRKMKMLQHLILLLLGSALVLAQVPPVPVSNCFSSGYFRHPLDCSKFYRCVETLQSPLLPREPQFASPSLILTARPGRSLTRGYRSILLVDCPSVSYNLISVNCRPAISPSLHRLASMSLLAR